MTKPVVFNYPAASNVSVAALQTLAAAGPLALNATSTGLGVKGPGANGNVYVPFPGNYRYVTLTSGNNLSAVNFTIVGTLSGATQTEVLAGPNNNTVASVNLYDSIISITASAAAAAVSAGISILGFTAPWFYDVNATVASTSVLVAAGGSAGTVTVSLFSNFGLSYLSLGNAALESAGIIMPQPGNAQAYHTVLSSQVLTEGTNQLAYFNYPINFATLQVTAIDGGSAFNGGLTVVFIQQGVK